MKRTCRPSLLLLCLASSLQARVVETDICVYGGAAGGVTAAIQARRMGKSVSLVVFNSHLGGLTTAGLGQTDLGNNGDSYIQGISREFYVRVGAAYGLSSAKFTFEPKVAENVFNQWVAEADVPVHFNKRLAGVVMKNGRIFEFATEGGDVFRARMFIDASYEGDLLKKAGVSYTSGREPNSQYGETINGVQTATSGNQLPDGISPYVVPGNPASGLIRGVNATPPASNGSGDPLIQAFCYRMCLTNVAANRVMIAQPSGYDEADYEILFRAIEAGQTNKFWKLDGMPNGKTDSNNASGISCDLISGDTAGYIEADYTTRGQIAQAHERWQRGLVWTVQNHPRVPSSIRSAWSAWGLPLDEFADTGHWPHQLYVREARRMVSDYVMTEKNCLGTVVAADSIGLGGYTMDSHNCQRIITNGMVKNEGDIQRAVPGAYPISYRSLVPKVGECPNLLVPWSVSSTHISFGSIRMEPVFMVLGQSAATAACLALDDDVDVQALSYAKLRNQLLADGQKLTPSGTDPSAEIIVDNASPTWVEVTGTWIAASATAGYQGADYLHDANSNKGACSVRFTPDLPATASYQVYLRWTSHTNRASNVPVEIRHPGGLATTTVDERSNGGTWYPLGTYSFNAGAVPGSGSVTMRNAGTNGFVVADAVRFVQIQTLPSVSLWATDGQLDEPLTAASQAPGGRFTLRRTGSTTAPLTVSLSFGGTAQNGVDVAALPASVTIPAGASFATVPVTALADGLAEGDEVLILTAASDAGYILDPLNEARLTIRDLPFDAWRKSHFTPAELLDPAISGPEANPDGDGLNNLMESLRGSDPRIPDATSLGLPGTMLLGSDVFLTLTYSRAPLSDILCVTEVSADLTTWNSGAEAVEETVLGDDGETLTIQARDLTPLGEMARRFIRLRVSQ